MSGRVAHLVRASGLYPDGRRFDSYLSCLESLFCKKKSFIYNTKEMDNQNGLQEGRSTGFIPVEPKPGDWEIRGESGVSEQYMNALADWRKYVPANQGQKLLGVTVNGGNGFETDACVSFSAEQSMATYLNFLISVNGLAPAALDFLKKSDYIVDGKVALSPRFLAKVSGTTSHGNSLPNVMDAARKFGMVPDSLWSMPEAQIKADPANAWGIYYADIPQSVLDLGKGFLKHFTPQYDWVAYTGVPASHAELSRALVTAPIQVAAAVCPPWNTSAPIAGCGVGSAHATELLHVEASGISEILDHYDPFLKQLGADYAIAWAMRILVSPLDAIPVHAPNPSFKHFFRYQLDFAATGDEVIALQEALRADGEFPSAVQSTGYFGTVTLLALQKFQVKYGIASSGTPATTGYGRVGPATIVKLNELFNK